MIPLLTVVIAGTVATSYADPVEDTQQDHTSIIFDSKGKDRLVCDTTLRVMPDGSWVMIMLGFGHTELLLANRIVLSRSRDQGQTWTPIKPIVWV